MRLYYKTLQNASLLLGKTVEIIILCEKLYSTYEMPMVTWMDLDCITMKACSGENDLFPGLRNKAWEKGFQAKEKLILTYFNKLHLLLYWTQRAPSASLATVIMLDAHSLRQRRLRRKPSPCFLKMYNCLICVCLSPFYSFYFQTYFWE